MQEPSDSIACYLHFVRSYNTQGEQIFCYLAVPDAYNNAFLQSLQSTDILDLTQFGHELLSGKGDPTPEDMQFMEETFGFKHKELHASTPRNAEQKDEQG